jgi:hypothetical protein
VALGDLPRLNRGTSWTGSASVFTDSELTHDASALGACSVPQDRSPYESGRNESLGIAVRRHARRLVLTVVTKRVLGALGLLVTQRLEKWTAHHCHESTPSCRRALLDGLTRVLGSLAPPYSAGSSVGAQE